MVERQPSYRKVAGLIPGQWHVPGLWVHSSTWLEPCRRQLTNVSLTWLLLLSHSPHFTSTLCEKQWKNFVWWGLTNKQKNKQQKIEHTNSNNSTKESESKDLNNYWHIHVNSSIIHNSPKLEAIQVSIDKWLDKQNVVHIYNGISSLKKEGNLTPATTRMNFTDTIVSEISQSQKNEYGMIPLIWGS